MPGGERAIREPQPPYSFTLSPGWTPGLPWMIDRGRAGWPPGLGWPSGECSGHGPRQPGLDLTFALLAGYAAVVVLVDAVPRGGPPGTLVVVELAPGRSHGERGVAPVKTHSLDPVGIFRVAASLGAWIDRVILVRCEPSRGAGSGEFGAELSPELRRALDRAVPLIVSVVERLMAGGAIEACGAAGVGAAQVAPRAL